jgi:3-oxo-5-alpha-steroid 4-dehydrogenase 3
VGTGGTNRGRENQRKHNIPQPTTHNLNPQYQWTMDDNIRAFGACGAAVLYLMLSVTAIVSLFSPFLAKLASHGKTRVVQVESQDQDDDSIAGTKRSILSKILRLLDHELLQIPKRYFSNFYSFGFTWSGYILWNRSKNLAAVLLYLHLVRRFAECQYVHRWSGTMHLAGYALGLLHYFLLPLMFQFYSNQEMRYRVFGVLLNIYSQYNQYLHHSILASYRCQAQSNQRYSIPVGNWFQFISCPHYLAEILIYASFTILLHDDGQHDHEIVCDTGSHRRIAGICSLILPWRNCVFLTWVTINLAVSARSTHAWYHKKFQAYPKKRRALIPCVW